MKKIITLWISLALYSSSASAQTWNSFISHPAYSFLAHPTEGILVGSNCGVIYRLNNGVEDTIVNLQLTPNRTINNLALSQDTLFFSYNSNHFFKCKIGEDPIESFFFSGVQNPTINKIVAIGTKRWFATDRGLYYFNGSTYSHNSSDTLNVNAMAVDALNYAYIAEGNNLYSVHNGLYTLITDTIPNINWLAINPSNNKLYFSTPGKLYYKDGNSIVEVTSLQNSLISFNNNVSVGTHILYFSFDASGNSIYLTGKSATTGNPRFLMIYCNNEWHLMDAPEITPTTYAPATQPVQFLNQNRYYLATTGGYIIDSVYTAPEYSIYNIIDKGDFRALVGADGSLFRTGNLISNLFEHPKNSGLNTGFTSTLWLAGISQTNDTCIAATRFNQVGRDYWAGPIAQNYNENYQQRYQRVWKINRSDINQHIAQSQQSGYVIPSAIATWPAHGNIFNGEAPFIAPFYDVNANGIYEPLLGDYPIVFGQQAIYFIFNDTRAPHTESGGNTVGAEVHGMAYVMDSVDMALSNTLFVKYNIFNRSSNNYHEFHIGKFDDIDLGYGYDDFLGCDTTRQLFYFYNGTAIDGQNTTSHSYGAMPPVQGVTFLNNDMFQFNFFNNTSGEMAIQTDPDFAIDYWNYLNGKWKDGSPLTVSPLAYGGTETTKYAYFGNPLVSTPSQWTERTSGESPNDRRGLGSALLNTFPQGTNYCMDIAYVYSRDCVDTLLGNNNTNIAGLFNRTDTIRSYFNQSNLSCNMNNIVFNATPIPDFNSCQHVAAFANNSQINYTEPIDSVALINIVGITSMQAKTSWRIYQGTKQAIQLDDVIFNVQTNVPVVLSLNLMHNPNVNSMYSYTINYFVNGLTSVNELFEAQILIQPNPSNGKIKISGIEHSKSLTLFDLQGRQIWEKTTDGSQSTMDIDFTTLKKGIYILNIKGNHNSEINKKVVIE